MTGQRYISILAFLVLTTSLVAQPITIEVQTVRERALTGSMRSLSRDQGLSMIVDPNRTQAEVLTPDLVRIAFGHTSEPPRMNLPSTDAERHTVVLVNGDRLTGRPQSFANERIGFRMAGVGELVLPLDRVAFWMTPAAVSSNLSVSDARLLLGSPLGRGDDALLLANRDLATGVLTAIDWDGFALETDDGERRFAHDRVLAAGVVNDPPTPSAGLVAALALHDGSVLHVGDWRLDLDADQPTLSVRLVSGENLRLNVAGIEELEIAGGRWWWLDEQTPYDVEHVPPGQLDWPHRTREDVLGDSLQTAGRMFDRGLGVHSRSVLTYRINGEYDAFTTYLGMDDSGGPLSNVDIAIVVDGQRVFEQANISCGKLYGPVTVPLTGASQLSLVVGFGKHGGVQDRFNWLDAALIRSRR